MEHMDAKMQAYFEAYTDAHDQDKGPEHDDPECTDCEGSGPFDEGGQ